ncbi:MAG: AMP-binding protein [Porticoccaceae bacterium]
MAVKRTLGDFFAERMVLFADQPALTCLGHTLTYGDLDRLSSAFASFLEQELKLAPGDRLAIQLPNLLQYPVIVIAAIKAGITIVNTNPLYTTRELAHQLKDSGARAMVVLRGLSGTLAEVIEQTQVEHVIVTEVGDLHPPLKRHLINTVMKVREFAKPRFKGGLAFGDALAKGQGKPLSRPLAAEDSIAVLQYTGGTTGVSKGAMLTHINLLSNLRQAREAFGDTLQEGREIIVAPLPIYHIFAFMLCIMLGVDLGARLILIPDPRNGKQFVGALKGVPFTFFAGLNTLFNALARNPQFKALDFSQLRITVSGGMALMKDTAEKWEAVTGCKIVEGYGLTEASPVVALNPPHAPRLGTVGKLMPSTECRIIDGQGQEVPRGEPGELLVKGPQVMKGYWNQPDATREILDDDGWLHTGDVAQMDEEGYISIVDRIKDMVVVSGFNVYPNEVEDEMLKHPDIVECAVIGVPDVDTVEAVKLFVVTDKESLTREEVRDFARRNLTGYKVPKYVEFIDELPKSNVGKVLRKELRKREG